MLRMRLGMFDPLSQQPYSQYPLDVVNSADNRALARRIADESIVLLKNEPVNGQPLLPLHGSLKVALIGPNANATDTLCSNYYGTLGHVVSVNEAFTEIEGMTVTYVKGCDINSQDKSGFQAAVDLAQASDVVVLVMGLDQSIESEG